jgi:hypothetical protein
VRLVASTSAAWDLKVDFGTAEVLNFTLDLLTMKWRGWRSDSMG